MRPAHELFHELLVELCARADASSGLAAARVAPARGAGVPRILASCGEAAARGKRDDEVDSGRAAIARALATREPAREDASAELPALLALPLCARGELLGVIALERSAGGFTEGEVAALAALQAACGELLLGYERAAVRARAEEDLVRALRHLQRSAALDGLTGLASRAATQRALADAALRSNAAGIPLAVIAFDVDEAKRLADAVGAHAFDEAIAHTARTLQGTLRPTDWCGRWGIDVFVVALLGCDAESAAVVAERVRLRIEGAGFVTRGGAELVVTVSAGIASTGLVPEDGVSLAARAMRALEEAKRAGRNRVCASRPARA
jgi:diguanylate cyclase (GGDEF)-like protein